MICPSHGRESIHVVPQVKGCTSKVKGASFRHPSLKPLSAAAPSGTWATSAGFNKMRAERHDRRRGVDMSTS